MTKQTAKRCTALALCLALGLSLVPAPALAAELPEETAAQTDVTEEASSAAEQSAPEETPEAAQGSADAPEEEEQADGSAQPERDPADGAADDASGEETAEQSAPGETAEEQTETEWVNVTDPTQIADFVWENWSDDYFEEAVVDPKRERVTVDGEKTTVEEAFGAQAVQAGILDSASAAERYFEETPYEAEKQSDGTVAVTAPYQTCRIVVNAASLAEDYGAETILHYQDYDEYVLQFADEESTQAAYEALADRYGEDCYTDEVFSAEDCLASESGSGSYAAYSWGADYMGLTERKNGEAVSGSVTVALIDTGCDTDNWFFEGRTFSAASHDFPNNLSGPENITDVTGHGTHVAGIVADCTPENVELMVLRVFSDTGSCTSSTVQSALQYATEQGANVINISLALTSGFSSAASEARWESALKAVWEQGVPVICAAGNSRVASDKEVAYPASSAYTVAVSNITKTGALSSSSRYGDTVDFCAPGTEIVSALDGGAEGKTTTMSGTSMAAPHVAAAFAWLRLLHPEAETCEALYQLAKDCAVDLGDAGKDDRFGWGYPFLGSGTAAQMSCTLSQSDYTYTGSPYTPAVTVTLDGETLTEGTDYTLAYADNVEPGTARVTATLTADSACSKTLSFTIRKRQPTVSAALPETTLYIGESAQLSVSTRSEGELYYDTDDFDIADVDETGLVTACGEGVTTITVTAEESDHDEEAYDTVEVTVKLLDTPQLLSGANTAKGVQVKWKAVENAALYRVFRRTTGGWKALGDTASTSFTDTAAKAGTSYTYTVRCVTADGENYASGYSASGVTVRRLLQPKVTLTNAAKGVTVKWSKVAGADGYDLYRRTGSGSWKKLKSTGSLSCTDTGASNGKTYSYRVIARHKATGSASAYSAAGSIYRLGSSSFTRLKNKAKRKLCLRWKANSAASGYEIQYALRSDFSGAKTVAIKSGKKHCKQLTGLKKGRRYYVRVRSCRTVNGKKVCSAWSGVKSIKIRK